ncbi:MAG: glycosyltransferase family 4 protein [Flavobacteriales bacterium]
MKKLLLIGSNTGNTHLKNYLDLVRDYFDEVMVVSDNTVEYAASKSVSFSLKHPLRIKRSIEKLRSIILEYNPSVIHVHQANSYAFITGKANQHRIPLVLTTWGSDVLLLPKKSFIHRWLVIQALRYADLITADSVQMLQEINALCPGKELVNANFGVDFELPEAMNADRELILYSNRMHEPLYRIEDILTQFKAMCEELDGQLILAGKGSLTEKLKDYTKRHQLTNHVTFAGFVTKSQNKSNYLKSKFFISIPTSDGTSISLLEAMAYGCIPVLSDLPANREWIEDGKNGIIIGQMEPMGEAIKRGIELDAKKVQHYNRDLINQRATKSANAALFKDIYARILASETNANR